VKLTEGEIKELKFMGIPKFSERNSRKRSSLIIYLKAEVYYKKQKI